MNKKYFVYGLSGLIILALIFGAYFVFIPQQFIPGTTCFGETDSGYDLYNKGTVTFTTGDGSPIQNTDKCLDDTTLREYNCVDHPTYVSFHDVECACSNGACESDLCQGVSCFNKCDAGNRLYDGECNPLTGACEYRQEICQFGCENSRCQVPDCVANTDCSSNEECIDNKCVEKPECLENSECGNTQKCLDNKCVDTYQCTNNDDCEQDEECKNDVCVEKKGCLFDSDCSNTENCINGKCKDETCTEGEITEYFECSDGDRTPECICLNGIEQCNVNASELCKKSYTAYIVIGIIVVIIMLILLYSLLKRK